MLIGKRWLHLKGQYILERLQEKEMAIFEETDFMGRNKLINYY